MIECDVAVLGAGPGGYVAAIRAAQRGARVVVIERAELGGVCLNWGCIPTKTLIHAAKFYHHAKQAADFGVAVEGVRLDLAPLLARKNNVIGVNKSGIRNLFKAHKIQTVAGVAHVAAADRVYVGKEEIRPKAVIVATGSEPAQIPGLEFDGKRVIGSTEALELTEPPKRAVVIGAGALGAEFASMWNLLGTDVTLVELMPRVLPLEDEELSTEMARVFKKRKMDVRAGTKVAKLERGKASLRVTLEGEKPGQVETDIVLVGIGRKYNTGAVTKDPALGVKLGAKGEILVNERMETSVPGIFAIGDVTGKTLLAHGASAEALVAAENAVGGNRRMDYRVVPACTFTTPEVAHVGLTEKQAIEQGYTVRCGRFRFAASGRAHAMGETDGLVKIVADTTTDEILGVHIMGPEAGELIATAALAIQLEATVEDIAHTIHTHPTLSETLMEAAEDYYGLGIHTPPRRR